MTTIEWNDGKVRLLDQTQLPARQVTLEIDDYHDMIEAIQSLRVRGAPALGVATAYAMVLAAAAIKTSDRDAFLEALRGATREIVAARPTAVNMAWAADRMLEAIATDVAVRDIASILLSRAQLLHENDVQANRRLGAYGAALIPDHATVLTHCNAGSLATAGYGTALGVIRGAREAGKTIRVMATETRPLLQGARLTTWELLQDGFDVTLITDSMAGHFLKSGEIACVVVGADRIALNGDVANKIGTYAIAVLAKENGIPFFVAAPTSTIDPTLATGDEIPIEQRPAAEVMAFGGVPIAPEGVRVANPAFDVTPNRFVSAIITEGGVVKAPYREGLERVLEACAS